MGGWMNGWVEEKEGIGVSFAAVGVDWVGGWVGGWERRTAEKTVRTGGRALDVRRSVQLGSVPSPPPPPPPPPPLPPMPLERLRLARAAVRWGEREERRRARALVDGVRGRFSQRCKEEEEEEEVSCASPPSDSSFSSSPCSSFFFLSSSSFCFWAAARCCSSKCFP